MSHRLPILCYHKVGPCAEEGRYLNVEPDTLDAHIRFFQRRGRRFVCVRDLGGRLPESSVCLSFDDGYISTLTYGVSVMERRGVSGSIFVVPALVGQTSNWDKESARPLASWDLLRDADSRGFEIGDHTMHHYFLEPLIGSEVAREIDDSRALLASSGLSPQSICYPYGSVSPEAIAHARAAGYVAGVTLEKRWAVEADDRLALPRITVAFGDRLPLLIYRVFVRPLLRRSAVLK